MSGGRRAQTSQDGNGRPRGRPDGSRPPGGRARQPQDAPHKCQRGHSRAVSGIPRTSVSAS